VGAYDLWIKLILKRIWAEAEVQILVGACEA